VSAEGISTVTGQEANERIDRIYNALWGWGIRKGTKVALTGINSVDYMTLEQALGLLGAVSVPIYFTTPAAEASVLLEKSGATWFFVGDKRMVNQLSKVETEARIVIFSAGLEEEHSGAMEWEEFLARAEKKAPRQYPDPEDLATIRYTSGTTGEPKGVMFNYGQLAWMGEVLTNLLTWKDRNDQLRYLSFLPLSHVVEGILASYAPYYVLCKVDYFFLNDFSSLAEALPRVRPTVFFSVPRFYEKVWEQITANKLGQRWLGMKDGPRRKAVAAVLRRAALRKAGIDRCGQLIVGSAPVSEALLNNFRQLGIEVYNAYGQTEAPLITINRFGDNVIPSIGTPLPETQVTAEPDGELIVTGPQVALGYYGLQTETIRDGVLRTGDLGVIHEDGHITLRGRKKDFIVTAYGKNISITKLEERLKDIPGVSEAVLIGENRPYCTALLWLEDGLTASELQIEDRIQEMNGNLSHPEQIRRYSVIHRPLSIQAGELTPNLKVKRGNVEEHLAEEIEEMYR
jgi:long-chain acyl-CoA synthetase